MLVVLAALTLAVGCDKPLTLEQQIIATIRDMEARIENRERRAFMAKIAPDFSGRNGNMNREQLRALVVFRLNRHKELNAQLFPIQVEETTPGQASARVRALVTGGAGWLPESGQVFDFVTEWRRDDDEWLLVGADWTPVDLNRALDEVL